MGKNPQENNAVVVPNDIELFYSNSTNFQLFVNNKNKVRILELIIEPSDDYKLQLKNYSKYLKKEDFDIFGRGQRIIYKGVKTSVGQLRVFKWCIEKEYLQSMLYYEKILYAN